MHIVKLSHTFKVGVVVALALFAAACGQKSGALAPLKPDLKALEARLDAAPSEKFVLKADGAADIAAIVAATPKTMKVSYATVTFDAASGATVINQLRIAPADQPDVGISIDQLKVWGLDTALAVDRLSGKQLDKTLPLARRIEATGITPFGLDKFLSPAMEAYTGAVSDVASDVITSAAGPDTPESDALRETLSAELNAQITAYEASIGRIIIDDLYLRPWVLTPAKLPADSDFAEVMPLLQGYAAGWRSLAFDFAAMYDMKVSLSMTQSAGASTMTMTMPAIGYRGFRGGDTDLAVLRGLGLDMNIASSVAPDAPPVKMAISETVERSVVQGSRLDKVLGYLARGVMPPRTETGLLSFGVTTMDNFRISFDGGKTNILTIGAMTIDLTSFQWFVPVRGRMKVDDFVYDIPALMAYAQSMAPPPPAPVVVDPNEPPPPPVAIDPYASSAIPDIDPAIMAILVKYGLDKPSFDTDFGWDWNTKTGALRIDTAYGLDGYARFDIVADLIIPAFMPISDLIPESGEADNPAIATLFEKVSAFKSGSFNLVDEGGLEKGFALAVEIGKTLPPGDPSTAFLRNTTPANLRGIASNGAYLGADQAATQYPPAKDWLRPFAAWVTSGGAVHATSKPKTPVVFSEFGKKVESGDLAPGSVADAFNIVVKHEPPKGAAKKPE